MENEVIIAVIGSSALSALVSGFLSMYKDKHKKHSGVEAGVRMILYDRIKHLGNKYITRGNVSIEEFEDLSRMHKVYHDDLDGNGYLDDIMAAVRQVFLAQSKS